MNVIQIENLWKEYRLGVIGHGTLTHDLQSWWARVRGKEDPNSKLQPMLAGQEKQTEGDRFWALRDINLEVKEGEILGIIGRNGAGKSTLLKLLSRVTAPTKGQIKIKGRIASLLEVGTGFHPELTGRENIFMNGAILGMSKQEIKSKLDEIIDFSGVEKFIDTPVKRYSSGMYVRLAFAVAAHLEPEILVIDEVLAVGDAEFQKKCLGKMGEVSEQGRTVLFVSHNTGAIKKICRSGLVIKNGEKIFYGTSSDAIDLYINNFSFSIKPEKEWSCEEAAGTESLKFISFRIFDNYSNHKINFEWDEEVYIELKFLILSDNIDRYRVNVAFEAESSMETAFIASCFGTAEKTNKKEVHIFRLRISGKIFNCIKYNIFITVGIPFVKYMIKNFFISSININRSIDADISLLKEKCIGVMHPEVKWKQYVL